MTPLNLMKQCAPLVAPVTMAAIVQNESGGNPLVLHDNTDGTTHRAATTAQAIALAKSLIALGHSVDLGLAQINSRNLQRLGLSEDRIFDPCVNRAAAQTILGRGWRQSAGDLVGALSAYNTGNTTGGVGLRYGSEVFAKAGVSPAPVAVVPAIPGWRLAKWVAGRDLLATGERGATAPLPMVTPQDSSLQGNDAGL